MEPRGIRNNNPGNIRITKDKWKGLRAVQADKEFFQFITPKWGYRAMLRTLQNYRKRHGCETIGDFIRRWAPPSENNTTAYIRFVCNKMGVPPAYVPNVEDKATMCLFAYAISYYENGVVPVMEDISEGWDLL
jgi:hypothetical protein